MTKDVFGYDFLAAQRLLKPKPVVHEEQVEVNSSMVSNEIRPTGDPVVDLARGFVDPETLHSIEHVSLISSDRIPQDEVVLGENPNADSIRRHGKNIVDAES